MEKFDFENLKKIRKFGKFGNFENFENQKFWRFFSSSNFEKNQNFREKNRNFRFSKKIIFVIFFLKNNFFKHFQNQFSP